MAEEEYTKKLESLQQYIPFLNNMITQLKDPSRKNREQQLNKMESLLSMITDKRKKLKLDTLIKCEDVIMKLHDKVNAKPQKSKDTPESPMETPASPSPPREMLPAKPVVIPTEKVILSSTISPFQRIRQAQATRNLYNRVDVYSSAAESLNRPSSSQNVSHNVFNRLGPRHGMPDMSKPPISLDDLKTLEDDVKDKIEKGSLNELTDLREQINRELKMEATKISQLVNTTIRNKLVPAKKVDSKPKDLNKKTSKPSLDIETKRIKDLDLSNTSDKDSKTKPIVSPIILKESDSIFGNLLSSLDEKIVGGKKKEPKKEEKKDEKKEERRSSTSSKSRDRHSSESSSKPHHKSDSSRRDSSSKSSSDPHRKKESTSSSSRKDSSDRSKPKRDSTDHKDKKPSSSHHSSKSREDHKKTDKKDPQITKTHSEKKEVPTPVDMELDSGDEFGFPTPPKPAAPVGAVEEKKPTLPTFKRLADKYNPKPRKTALDNPDIRNLMLKPHAIELDSEVTNKIETNMKLSPIKMPSKIPYLEASLKPAAATDNTLALELLNNPKTSMLANNIVNQLQIHTTNITTHCGQPHLDKILPNNFGKLPQKSNTSSNFFNQANSFPQIALPVQPRPFLHPNPNQNQAVVPKVSHPAYQEPNQFQTNQFNNRNSFAQPFSPNGGDQARFQSPPNRNFNNQFNQQCNNVQLTSQITTSQQLVPNNYQHRNNMQQGNFNSMMGINQQPMNNLANQPHNNPKPLLTHPSDIENYYEDPTLNNFMDGPTQSNDNFGFQDQDQRFPTDNRGGWRADTQRDPRNRDPRNYREYREMKDNRDRENKDNKDNNKDNRDVNRFTNRDPRDRGRSRFREPEGDSRKNRYSVDHRFDKNNYASTSRGRGRGRFDNSSPLRGSYKNRGGGNKGYGRNNLFTSNEEEEVDGWAVVDAAAAQNQKESAEVDGWASVDTNKNSFQDDWAVEKPPAKKSPLDVEEWTIEEPLPVEPKVEEPPREPTPVNPQVVTEQVKQEHESPEIKPKVEKIEKVEKVENVDETLTEKNTLFKFFANLLGNDNSDLKKDMLKSIIGTFSESLGEKITKRMTEVLENDDESDGESDLPLAERQKLQKKAAKREKEIPNDTKPQKPHSSRRSSASSSLKENSDQEDPIVETLGDRIKNRRRAPKVKQRKCRTELDLLHEDIQDMFIRDGVLTANGKRMCNMLKNDPNALTPKKSMTPRQKAMMNKSKKQTPEPDLKSMRVVISKIPDDYVSEEKRLTRSARKAIAKGTDDVTKEEIVTEDASGGESADETLISDNEDANRLSENIKKGIAKRKRNRWAAGIIPKKKKHVQSDVDDKALELHLADVDEFENYTTYSLGCKLCVYTGRFLISHYKRIHPDSEVLNSRLPVDKALAAIEDSIKNLAKYEEQAKAKITQTKYGCRICGYETNHINVFYDHMTTHTGEFRHNCGVCNYSASASKAVHQHFEANHPNDPRNVVHIKLNSKFLFGFICGECNFFQISERAVRDHIKIYHLGDSTNCFKINLSEVPIADDWNISFVDESADDKEVKPVAKKRKSGKDSPLPVVKKRQRKAKDEEKKVEEESSAVIEKKDLFKEDRPGPASKKRAAKEKAAAKVRATFEEEIEREESPPSANVEPVSEPNDELASEDVIEAPAPKAKRRRKVEKVKEEEEAKVEESLPEAEAKEVEEEKKEEPPQKVEENIYAKAYVSKEDIDNMVKKQKKIERNVFTCETDLEAENVQIESERLETMQALNKAVGSRNSLNFVDKLSNRLANDVEEAEAEKNEMENLDATPEEPILEESSEILTMPVLEKCVHSKPTLDATLPTLTSMTDVSTKSNQYMSGILEKLQGVLSTTAQTESNENSNSNHDTDDSVDDAEVAPPPLIHVDDLEEATTSSEDRSTLDCGYIRAIKNADGITYSCLIPSCTFNQKDKVVFQEHCKQPHTYLSESNVSSFACNACGKEVSELEKLFLHLLSDHEEFVQVDVPKTSIVRTRKFSGDIFSNIEEDNVGAEVLEDTTGAMEDNAGPLEDNNGTEPLEDPIRPLEAEVLEDNAGPLEDNAGAVTLEDTTGAETLVEVEQDQVPTKESTEEQEEVTMSQIDFADDNPFPFKILDVVSLADRQPPPLTPIPTAKPPTPALKATILVKEAIQSQFELTKKKKTASALTKQIQSISELYKCPHYYCSFSTNFRDPFEVHIKQHNVNLNTMVACVYCDLKTPLKHVAMHIDLRHAHCCFACRYCLYRGLYQEYVIFHQEAKHSDMEKSIVILNSKRKYTVKNQYVDPRQLCKPFRCTSSCKVEYLFENDFKKHLQFSHDPDVKLECGFSNCNHMHDSSSMIIHWSNFHSVCIYQCAYCMFSANNLHRMYIHFTDKHQNMYLDILYRRGAQNVGYTDQAFAAIKHITTFQNREVIDPTSILKNVPSLPKLPIEEKKTKTNVLSIQKLPIEEKKPLVTLPKIVAVGSVSQFKTAPVPEPPIIMETNNEDPLAETENGEVVQIAESSDDALSSPKAEEDRPVVKIPPVIGLAGPQLYKCVCRESFPNSVDLKDHLTRSESCKRPTLENPTKQYKCVHCNKCYRLPLFLVEHIGQHGVPRFACSMCDEKLPTNTQIRNHLKSRHNVFKCTTVPVDPNNTNTEYAEFIVTPKSRPTRQSDPAKKEAPVEPAPAPEKQLEFEPTDIDKIPIRSIFSTFVKCSACLYQTKVRTNLVRHLQFHLQQQSVPDTAPVNPVPCLDKNEKMFDKMVNLAISSQTGGRMGGSKSDKVKSQEDEKFPEYIAAHCRYVCCAENCSYICQEETNFRHHLVALHSGETAFTCAHCKMHLHPTDTDSLIQHFRLHDLHLFRCNYCDFMHYLKNKCERHAMDKHTDLPAKVLTLRYMESEQKAEPFLVPAAPGGKNKPWRCCICKARSATLEDIQAHVLNKHDIDAQFKCALCTYKTNEKEALDAHIADAHTGQTVEMICAYHKVVEGPKSEMAAISDFDTTPLWQRNRPRVRHIRGILFEEASANSINSGGAKSPKKAGPKPSTSGQGSPNVSFHLDKAIEAVATGQQEQKIKPFLPVGDEVAVKEEANEFVQRYGGFGENYLLQFNCPVCHSFKTTNLAHFIYHMYRENNVHRYMCTICKTKGITLEFITNHTKKHNENGAININQFCCLAKDEQLDTWLEMVIYHQTNSILKIIQPSKLEESSDFNYICKFCKRRFEKVNQLFEHQLVHWSKKPFACGTCAFEAFTELEVEMHARTKHPNLKLMVIYQSPTVQDVLYEDEKDLAAKYPFNLDSIKVKEKFKDFDFDRKIIPQEEIANIKQETDDVDILSIFDLADVKPVKFQPPKIQSKKPLVPQKKKRKSTAGRFYCMRCAFIADSKSELNTHNRREHPDNPLNFKFAKENDGVLIECTFCGFCDIEINARHHHLNVHPDQNFLNNKFRCGFCGDASTLYTKCDTLRFHIRLKHPHATERIVGGDSAGSSEPKLLQCTRCPREGTSDVLRVHMQGHFKAYSCDVCGVKLHLRQRMVRHKRLVHKLSPEDSRKVIVDHQVLEECKAEMAKVLLVVGGTTARKSTGKPMVKRPEDGYSFYGCQPEPVDLKRIMTTVELNKMRMPMTAEQLSKIFNLSAYVSLEDCGMDGLGTSMEVP